jgi:hypothetical protein
MDVFNHLRRDSKFGDSKIVLQSWTVTGLESDGRGEVVYRRTSLYSDVIWNNVSRMIRMRTK